MHQDTNTINPTYSLSPIGTLSGGYKEKFGIPRQSGLINNQSTITMHPPYHNPDAFRGLEDFSHLWIEFLFHQNLHTGWKPTVRPPRLGGNEKLGVFATRSSFRPNGLGLSVVKLLEIQHAKNGICLLIEGADMVDGTPIVDIKPYLPYADCVAGALGGFAHTAPEVKLSVSWSTLAMEQLATAILRYPDLQSMLECTLALDPRPAYHRSPEKKYGIHLYDYNILWSVSHDTAVVHAIEQHLKGGSQ